MDTTQSLRMLSALANEARLAIFRALVAGGGMAAGELAEQLNVPTSTLSFHLKDLRDAGLITSRRKGRYIYYAANVAGLGNLLGFLSEDCCGGHPELCLPASITPPVKKPA